jgi:hypothetical protein
MTKKKAAKKNSQKARGKKPYVKPARKAKSKGMQMTIPVVPEPQSVTTVEVETERKLSTKIIVGKRIGKVTAPTDLYTVAGIATGTKVGQSTYGEWIGIRGSFEVTRLEDGKVFKAPLMILPELGLAPVLECATGDVAFAALVSVDPSTNQAGFEIRVTWLEPPHEFDCLAGMREALRYGMTGASS